MKKILGLDLGTNSIGWSLIEHDFDSKTGNIIDCGSRIIPMSKDIQGKFDAGQTVSQTADRTHYRGVRRLRQRHLLRRERLHRVLNILKFLPEHYSTEIDFHISKGQFKNNKEVKLNYKKAENGKMEFLFKDSFNEMLSDFKKKQPEIINRNCGIPYDWTIYYLRNKALTRKISKEELSWILLNFNQKRGYYQLRGEEEETPKDKKIEFICEKVTKVEDTKETNAKGQIIYKIHLQNGLFFHKPSKYPVDWEGKNREFIVTTTLLENGNPKLDKEGNITRSFRSVDSEKDWIAIKKKTENEIDHYETVGEYIYKTLLKNPQQKIRGKLIRTIERKYYKKELSKILKSQIQYHPELRDKKIYRDCIEELYPNNPSHKNNIRNNGFEKLFIEDIIFYQRPLKSKKSLIDGCKFERRYFNTNGEFTSVKIKCAPKSNPYFQEFRLWQFISNLRILKREEIKNGKIFHDENHTGIYITDESAQEQLFDFLNARKAIDQKALLKFFNLKEKDYRWNYVEDKVYPCQETRSDLITRFSKIRDFDGHGFLTKEKVYELWHLIYSVKDKKQYETALKSYAIKNAIPEESFRQLFKNFPPYKADYCAYSEKAMKRLLALMRCGRYWSENTIDRKTQERIQKIIDGEIDEKISIRAREKAIHLNNIESFRALPLWLASYIIYDRHSEAEEIKYWKNSETINSYLQNDFKQHMLRNPIVEEVIGETLRVVRDIWNYHGKGKENFFDEIHIELGREMKNPAEKRKKITQKISDNENTNQRIRELLIELKNDGVSNVRPYSPSQHEILKLYEEGVYEGDQNISDDILKIRKKSQPTNGEIKKYKLWLEQGYISPYTGKMIQLSRLFTTDYQIEHVIPQSRYFDDSLSNKIICESEVNEKKGNMTAMEFIINHGGENIALSNGRTVNILSRENYETHIRKYFNGNRTKIKKLLTEDIPDSFIERQMNDSRYISKLIKGLLSNIVREENEMESTSKNVITINGAITSKLKQDWGLNDVWNSIVFPRFERLNAMTKTENYGTWISKNGNRYFQTRVPAELAKGFNKKRIDHRHHTLDAIIIAATTREHVNYITSLNTKRENHAYVAKLRRTEKYNNRPFPREYLLPWPDFNREVKSKLDNVIVSFKQNLRIINKTSNIYEKWLKDENGKLQKKKCRQIKGDNWAIRRPLHKEMIYGKVRLKRKKDNPVSVNVAIENYIWIVDKKLKNIIKQKTLELRDIAEVKKYFKKNPLTQNGEVLKKIDVYEEIEATAKREELNESFDSKKIRSVTDTGIQKILLNHLKKYDVLINEKVEEQPELAFSQEGIEEMNKNITDLNQGIPHKPILKVRVYEKGNRFPVGINGNKKDKYVEAAKDTNLFFAVYQNKEGKRKYKSIPLYIAIERQKQGLDVAEELYLDEKSEQDYRLLFTLSPNDLVYMPEEGEEKLYDHPNAFNLNNERIYKFVSCTGNRSYYIRNYISDSIYNKFEFSALNKMEKSIEGIMIKEKCLKIHVDRLGKIK